MHDDYRKVPLHPRAANNLVGLDLDWLASDAGGFVASFTTAGSGFFPEEFVRDQDEYRNAIREILALPPSTGPRFAPYVDPTRKNIWRMLAERGLFAFDTDPNGGPYELVAAPGTPRLLADLPASIAAVAGAVRFGHFRFEAMEIVPEELLQRRE